MPRLSVWMVRTALLEFGIGITLGTLMLWNKGDLIDPLIWLLLGTHQEILMVGWLIQFTLGIAFWILPRFTKEPRYGSTRRGWIGYILLNTGLLLVVISAWVVGTESLKVLGRLVELIAVVTLGSVLWPRVKPFGI